MKKLYSKRESIIYRDPREYVVTLTPEEKTSSLYFLCPQRTESQPDEMLQKLNDVLESELWFDGEPRFNDGQLVGPATVFVGPLFLAGCLVHFLLRCFLEGLSSTGWPGNI